MRKRNRSAFGFTVPAFAALLSVVVVGANEPPDLTKGETKGVDRTLTYNLGPTGLRGWIYTKPATFLDSVQGRTTAASRQILVTHVGVNSPASGVMEVDDVILGAGGSLFRDDARKSMGTAIQEAEAAANGGILKLTRFRAGKTEEVQRKLRVMGSYRETAPYDCPKSARILDEACKALAPDIFAAVETPCPADTMFGNEIRMGAFKALTKYRFKEGIAAGVMFAKTQGGHGSESRTGVIMKELIGYGTAAREALPGLRELIVQFNTECKDGRFPDDCNRMRVASVEEAIKAIEAATEQPELRSIRPPKGGVKTQDP